MSLVTLVSGGLDSTLVAMLVNEEGIEQYPLFINYGQLGFEREYKTCLEVFNKYGLPKPESVNLSGYGALISSGLTDSARHIYDDAFLPCRNLMFLTIGAAYAFQCNADAVAIGLLSDEYSLFPDHSDAFVRESEMLLSRTLGRKMAVKAPLMEFSKADVVRIAKDKGISGTYSCHAGTEEPCGVCVACKEYIGLEV